MSVYGEYGNRQDEFSFLSRASQIEIIEYCQVIATMMDAAWSAEVVQVCTDGYQITRGMVAEEIARTFQSAQRPAVLPPPMSIIGVNASSNMYA